MRASWQRIDPPGEGSGITFDIDIADRREQGVVVRYRGRLYAYINRCPHNGSTLDWVPGRFFSEDGENLVCQTHGARFAPESGECLYGPCPRGLSVLPLREEAGDVLVPSKLPADG